MRKNIQINAIVLLFITAWPICWTLDNGLLPAPPMGFKTPQARECNTEKYVKELADEMINQGYKQLGYEYLIITDPIFYASKHRNSALVPLLDNFPSGMKPLADYVHSKGLKIGLSLSVYLLKSRNQNNQSEYSPDDMKIHVQTLADWGIDYLQLQNAFADETDRKDNAMTNDADYWYFEKILHETANSIAFDCAWIHLWHKRSIPVDYKAITEHCNLYRMDYSLEELPRDDIIRHAGPGHWAYSENKIKLPLLKYNPTKWFMAKNAVFALPMMPDFYLQNLTSESKALLKNEEVIQVNQDPLRIPGRSTIREGDVEVAVRPITPVVEGEHSFALGFFYYGLGSSPVEYCMSLEKLQLNNTNGYIFTDLFSSLKGNRIAFTSLPGSNITVTISQGVALLKATPIPSKFRAPKK